MINTFYAERRRPDAVPVFGLDIAAPAVHYAQQVGLLDAAFTDDLEQAPPGPRQNRAIRRAAERRPGAPCG
ncbi:hypothetical protein [Streptomyces sp. F-1]|uniref:hypothetical protein n=1 Tax=Streptomyces sp. F-1 TaxID=463642 RepID=UPI00085C3A67|nr:hypothetical protein [Streptomyces sp. F-1]SFY53587.1 hypothetical protein STEPF1_06870 [Streptomyces sp. F-1]